MQQVSAAGLASGSVKRVSAAGYCVMLLQRDFGAGLCSGFVKRVCEEGYCSWLVQQDLQQVTVYRVGV